MLLPGDGGLADSTIIDRRGRRRRAASTLELPPFTLIGATTRTGLLTTPLRDRFGVRQRLEYYDRGRARARSCGARPASSASRSTTDGAPEIAARSRGTPRVANRLLRRVRDFAEVRHRGRHQPRDLSRRARAVPGRPRGSRQARPRHPASDRAEVRRRAGRALDTLAVALGEEPDTPEDVYEPYLLQEGLIKRTPRGRAATPAAFAHLGLAAPDDLARALS